MEVDHPLNPSNPSTGGFFFRSQMLGFFFIVASSKAGMLLMVFLLGLFFSLTKKNAETVFSFRLQGFLRYQKKLFQ